MRTKPPVKALGRRRRNSLHVDAIWLRRSGKDLEVLAEIKGQWIVVIVERWPADGCGEISHIVEALGVRRCFETAIRTVRP